MTSKSFALSDELHSYLVAHSTPPDDVIADLIVETRAALPQDAGMQVAPEQAVFLRLLTSLLGVREAVEVGTFTGLSSAFLALHRPGAGRRRPVDLLRYF